MSREGDNDEMHAKSAFTNHIILNIVTSQQYSYNICLNYIRTKQCALIIIIRREIINSAKRDNKQCALIIIIRRERLCHGPRDEAKPVLTRR